MICQHIAVEDLLQLFALFTVSNIPLVRFQQFCGIFLTEIRCLQCLQITGMHLKHIFVSLFAGATSVIRLSNAAYVSDVQNLIAESTFQQIEMLGEIWNIQKKTF